MRWDGVDVQRGNKWAGKEEEKALVTSLPAALEKKKTAQCF